MVRNRIDLKKSEGVTKETTVIDSVTYRIRRGAPRQEDIECIMDEVFWATPSLSEVVGSPKPDM